jgi:hypothetical protein
MRNIALACGLFVLSAFCMSSSCHNHHGNCEKVACTMVFASVSVYISNSTPHPVKLDDAYTIRISTNEKIRYNLDPEGGHYTVLDDSYLEKLQNRTDGFRFIGIKDGHEVVNEMYELAADCCHVNRQSGKAEIIL